MLKLTDFGLAKHLDAENSSSSLSSGMIMGTPSYMAPELAMARSTAAGPPVDVYGLGAVLYELLTGRPPFRGDSPMETVFQVVSHPPVPPSRLNDQVPEALEAICLKCLEKDPANRHASARELADALERLVSDRPQIERRRRLMAMPRIAHATKVSAAVFGIALAACLCVLALLPLNRPIQETADAGHICSPDESRQR